mmetsp:Transcript_31947/g.46679  ORF Transcript_31947/g.46679 Transcript_31947/m.46679 type:complete len:295 (+) Transcript_31947:7-891(+)
MAEGSDLSHEDKIKIAESFILDAPFGELKEVISDVQVLLGGEAVLADKLPGIVRQYNHARRVAAEGQATKVLLCEEGELSDGAYFDATAARCVRIEHVGAKILSSDDLEEKHRNAKVEEFRVPTQDNIAKYVASALSGGNSAVHGNMQDSDVKISVNLSGYKLNTRNFWTGHWCSHWTIVLADHGAAGSATLEGSISAKVHYYEDGNVHMTAKRSYSEPLTWTDTATFAAAMAKAISNTEQSYHAYLDDQYAGLPDRIPDCAFKSLRRKMPITQQRFQWDKVAAYSLARELTHK